MIFQEFLFYLFSMILIIAGFRVITAIDPVVSAFHLILAFFNTAMLWMLLNADFLALLMIFIYVGAVIVLLLFVIMMFEFELAAFKNKKYLGVGLLTASILAIEVIFLFLEKSSNIERSNPTSESSVGSLYNIGILMYTEYAFAIEVSAVLLLVSMITAIALTMRRHKNLDKKVFNPAKVNRVHAKDRIQLVEIDPNSKIETRFHN